jgi:hypothetical protein
MNIKTVMIHHDCSGKLVEIVELLFFLLYKYNSNAVYV